jgi:L-alanine-DL-glutamate epimerase-like enolase superfamily enzyme
MGKTWRYLVSDSQMRWVGPEKGVTHLALSAIVNALWDLWAKTQHKPVWQLVADMTPEEYVRCIDFRYITDALSPDEAIKLLRKQERGKAARCRKWKRIKLSPFILLPHLGWGIRMIRCGLCSNWQKLMASTITSLKSVEISSAIFEIGNLQRSHWVGRRSHARL